MGYADVVVASEGTIHIGCHDFANNDLKQGQLLSNGIWQPEAVDTAGDIGHHGGIAADANTMVHTAHCNDSTVAKA